MRERDGGLIVDEAENVRLDDITGAPPRVTYEKDGSPHARLRLHRRLRRVSGVSRRSIPATLIRTFERAYPFGWLGIMSETPPVGEVVYARHERGFALASLRNPSLSRYYIQCDLGADIADWPDERFWTSSSGAFRPRYRAGSSPARRSRSRSPRCAALSPSQCNTAGFFSPATLRTSSRRRARKAEPRGLGRLLSSARLVQHYRNGDNRSLECYSDMALRAKSGEFIAPIPVSDAAVVVIVYVPAGRVRPFRISDVCRQRDRDASGDAGRVAGPIAADAHAPTRRVRKTTDCPTR